MTSSVPAGAGGVDREAIRARAERASEGPWTVDAHPWRVDIDGSEGGWLFRSYAAPDCARDMPAAEYRQAIADAEFTAHARSDVPALLAALAAAEQRADARAGAIGRAADIHRPKRVQVGSKTHGGGPEYGDVCVTCREPYPCPTVAALSSRPVQPDMDGNHISIPGPVQPDTEHQR